MSWDSYRKQFEPRIKIISESVDYQLRKWAETGNYEHYLFAQHEIKHLKDLKDHILGVEREKANAIHKEIPSE